MSKKNSIYRHLLNIGLSRLLKVVESASRGKLPSNHEVSIAYMMHLIPPLQSENDISQGDVFFLEYGAAAFFSDQVDIESVDFLNIADLLLQLQSMVEPRFTVRLQISSEIQLAVSDFRERIANQLKNQNS